MTKAVLRNKLLKAIGEVEDESLLRELYDVLNTHLHADDAELTEEHKAMLDKRLLLYKSGKEKLHTLKEAKTLINKRK